MSSSDIPVEMTSRKIFKAMPEGLGLCHGRRHMRLEIVASIERGKTVRWLGQDLFVSTPHEIIDDEVYAMPMPHHDIIQWSNASSIPILYGRSPPKSFPVIWVQGNLSTTFLGAATSKA